MPVIGDTMMIPGDNGIPHLNVVIWGPDIIESEASLPVVLLACFCTINPPPPPHDPACELHQGDHPFIQHGTYVLYRKIRCDDARHVDAMVASGAWPSGASASADVIKRMRKGLCDSKLAKSKYKDAMGCPPQTPNS